MCLTAFSVVSAVFVANINHQAQGNTNVPYCLHKFTHGLGRLLCVKMVSWEERHCNIRQLAMVIFILYPSYNLTKNVCFIVIVATFTCIEHHYLKCPPCSTKYYAQVELAVMRQSIIGKLQRCALIKL